MQLLERLRTARTTAEVLSAHAKHRRHFEPLHAAAAWINLAALARRNAVERARLNKHHAAATAPLRETTLGLAPALPPRCIANVVYGAARTGLSPHHAEPLYATLEEAATRRLLDFNVSDHMQVAWGFTHAGWDSGRLLSRMAEVLPGELRRFDVGAPALIGLVSAFGEADHVAPAVAAALEEQLRLRVPYLTQGERDMVMLHLNRVAGHETALYSELKARSMGELVSLDGAGLWGLTKSISVSGSPTSSELSAIAREVHARGRDFQSVHLAAIATAFAKSNHVYDAHEDCEPVRQMFRFIGEEAFNRRAELTPAELGAFPRAFCLAAELGYTVVDAALFETLAQAAIAALDKFSARDMAQLAMAHSRSGLGARELTRAIVASALPRIKSFPRPYAISLLVSLSRLDAREHLSPAHLEVLEDLVLDAQGRLTEGELRGALDAVDFLCGRKRQRDDQRGERRARAEGGEEPGRDGGAATTRDFSVHARGAA